MRWLFAVFVISLCALLWAALAIARHIRRASHKLPAEAGTNTVRLPSEHAVPTDAEEQAALHQDVR